MSVPNFTNFPSEVSGALLSGSNGLSVDVVTGTPDKMVISAPNLTGVNSITATSLSGTSIAGAAIVTPLLNVSSSAGYGSVEVGGAQGGYIDFKKPFSDDSDLRVISDNTIEGGGYITNAGGAVLSLSGSNIGIGTNSPATVLDVASPGGITYDLVATEGAFRIGDSTNRIKMGVALSGLGAGNASIVTQGTNPKLNLGAGSTQALQETLRITGGNVGIGMDPSLKLDVSGTIRSRSNDQYTGLSIRNSTNVIASIFGDSAGNENGLLELNNNGIRTIQLFSAGNSYMLSGNVGIGTASPLAKLHISGSNTDSSLSTGTAILQISNINASAQTLFKMTAGAYTGGVRMDFAGNYSWHTARTPTTPTLLSTPKTEGRHDFYAGTDLTYPVMSVGCTRTYLITAGSPIPRVTIGQGAGVLYDDARLSVRGASDSSAIQAWRDSSDNQVAVIDTNGYLGLGTAPSYRLQLFTDSAAKPSTNTWTIASDSRLKENIIPYTKGLEAILQISASTYDYNGKAGFEKIKNNIGIIAQDVLQVLPECISTYKAKLNEDDKEETELYNFNSHALTYILINSVKQLKAENDLLKTRLDALENNLSASQPQ